MKRSSNKTPGLPPPSAADLAYRHKADLLRPKWIFYAIVAYIALAMVVRFAFAFGAWLRLRRLRGATAAAAVNSQEYGSPAQQRVSLRRLPAALTTSFRAVAYRWKVPLGDWHHMNGLTVFTAIAYMTVLFTLSFSSAHHNDPNLWANRVSHVTSLQWTFVVALSGKNNIISALTGIGYEKLNIMHRIAARSVLVVAWGHGFGRIRIRLIGPDSMKEVHHLLGLVSGIAYLFVFFLSLRPVRKWAYDFFLPVHIVLVLLTIISGYYHSFNFKYYMWSTFVVWGFDRLCRFLHLIYNNRLWRLLILRKSPAMTAQAELLRDDAIRLTLRRNMSWSPGHHVYVTIPAVSHWPLEAHPFSIATHPLEGQTEDPDGRRVILIVRPREGLTRRLANRLERQTEGREELTLLVDGPYGSPPSIISYPTVVLIAGGTGASYTMSYLLDIIHNFKIKNCATRRVVFAWAVKARTNLDWYSGTLESIAADVPEGLSLDVHVYVTQQDDSKSEGSQDDHEKSSSVLPFRLSHGRPDVAKIISDEVTSTNDVVSVGVSGPVEMAMTARRAMQNFGFSSVLKGGATINAHFEMFTNT